MSQPRVLTPEEWALFVQVGPWEANNEPDHFYGMGSPSVGANVLMRDKEEDKRLYGRVGEISEIAADILNGDAITPDHARALDLLREARDYIETIDDAYAHDLFDRIEALLTPPTTDIPRAASAPGAGHD